ncbi:MAG TPA: TetR/AcrR family transcriptional regulator [Devosia sp.]|jgi:AcrR family transcriptional regulator|nr:TetR/AcrR family transcriptional regulator [Devosia sp.]
MRISTDEAAEAEAKPGRRVAGQDPAKRNQILDGAKRCFLEVGFDAASMNDLTAAAGVSKGTLYVYFEDKAAILMSLIEREKRAALSAAADVLNSEGPTRDVLTRFGIHVTTNLTSDVVIKAQRMVLGIAERMPEVAQTFFAGDTFSAHTTLKDYLDAHPDEFDIADTDLASRQFLELSMASIYKRRLFGNLATPASEAQIARVVASAVDIFMSYYARR